MNYFHDMQTQNKFISVNCMKHGKLFENSVKIELSYSCMYEDRNAFVMKLNILL